jgi:hypothetical protein
MFNDALKTIMYGFEESNQVLKDSKYALKDTRQASDMLATPLEAQPRLGVVLMRRFAWYWDVLP